jgi:hypothetical protein
MSTVLVFAVVVVAALMILAVLEVRFAGRGPLAP